MAIFSYSRVRPREQTAENQHQEIERAGYAVIYWFADEGVSGAIPAAQRWRVTRCGQAQPAPMGCAGYHHDDQSACGPQDQNHRVSTRPSRLGIERGAVGDELVAETCAA